MPAPAPKPRPAFGPVHRLGVVDSTQNAAARAAAAGAPHGSVFWAEAQSAGRGRQGHGWFSPPGENLCLSVLLRPAAPVAHWLPLTLAAGLAVAGAVTAAAGARPDIRWPNDLLLGERKFAGILAETATSGAMPPAPAGVILGIGINVNQTAFPPDLAPLATSLRLFLGRRVDREALAAEILQQLRWRYDQWAEGGAAPVLAAFEPMSSYARGRRVRVGGPARGGGFIGTTAGLDPSGFLRVHPDGAAPEAMELVISGDVRPLEASARFLPPPESDPHAPGH